MFCVHWNCSWSPKAGSRNKVAEKRRRKIKKLYWMARYMFSKFFKVNFEDFAVTFFSSGATIAWKIVISNKTWNGAKIITLWLSFKNANSQSVNTDYTYSRKLQNGRLEKQLSFSPWKRPSSCRKYPRILFWAFANLGSKPNFHADYWGISELLSKNRRTYQ